MIGRVKRAPDFLKLRHVDDEAVDLWATDTRPLQLFIWDCGDKREEVLTVRIIYKTFSDWENSCERSSSRNSNILENGRHQSAEMTSYDKKMADES